jgi:acetyl esterase/lipase
MTPLPRTRRARLETLPSLVALLAIAVSSVEAQTVSRDLAYVESGHPRQVLDVYAPAGAEGRPVVFWIHGGGWQAGDKSSVALKPQAFMDAGLVFVSTNYRLLPDVDMETIVRDVARSIGWVSRHIAEYGGDPERLLIMGHSAGAQLAALIATDQRYLEAEGLSPSILKGCVPVDGDTYDIPAVILTEEVRRQAHGQPPPTFGHRQKFGNDPEKHREFSAVTHVAEGKGIPPFLVLYVRGHPYTSAQAQRLGSALEHSRVPVTLVGARDTNHSRLNDDLGREGDPSTAELFKFVADVLGE